MIIFGLVALGVVVWAMVGIVLSVYVAKWQELPDKNLADEFDPVVVGLIWPVIIAASPLYLPIVFFVKALEWFYKRVKDFANRPEIPKATAKEKRAA